MVARPAREPAAELLLYLADRYQNIHQCVHPALAQGRDRCPLFDMETLVARLEDLYQQIWDDYRQGILPRPDLRNLEIYYRLGLAAEHEEMDLGSAAAYRAWYRAGLADLDRYDPVPPDQRLWRK